MFVVDGHDIDMYPNVESAASSVEGYDAKRPDFLGADGTVYEATVEGPEWGPVRLRETDENQLGDLVRLLRGEAAARAVPLPKFKDDPEAIWSAVLAAERATRRPRRTWLGRRSKVAPSCGNGREALELCSRVEVTDDFGDLPCDLV